MNDTAKPSYGLIGLGTMGSNLALNIAEKGNAIAVFNRTVSRVGEFHEEAGELASMVVPASSLEEFVNAIERPRNIILMVPAGPVVDSQMDVLRPLLEDDDLIIDAGNAHFEDTNRRAEKAAAAGELFLGIGVSGGEEGARHGPSIMGGGDQSAWQRVEPVLQAISAKYHDTPCATWMGEGGAGHFVKMVHNGIEYADMQMIAEVYGLMRDGLGMGAGDIAPVFNGWNEGPLKSYLIEISGHVAAAEDPKTGKPVLDIILDSAGQKGTGRWTAIEALKLAAPVSVIDAAVAARNLSSRLDERKAGEALFGVSPAPIAADALPQKMMEDALLAGKIACYAQGFAMLSAASNEYKWSLPMPQIAEVWREGCIIRSTMLNDMASALSDDAELNLMQAPYFADIMKRTHDGLRQLVATAISHGHSVPALATAVAYFDTMRTARGTANMIQGQRDFFGAHSFGRLDEEGAHHGPWGMG
ncbi:MAG: NADP-dependent phosphogluconate dehydrogenase [Rhizobiaceae bacterium]